VGATAVSVASASVGPSPAYSAVNVAGLVGAASERAMTERRGGFTGALFAHHPTVHNSSRDEPEVSRALSWRLWPRPSCQLCGPPSMDAALQVAEESAAWGEPVPDDVARILLSQLDDLHARRPGFMVRLMLREPRPQVGS
jgi:hypothetical protein